MKEVNGKIFIENVDYEIKDVSQLDPRIYKTLIKLMQAGANIEIGPAILPKDVVSYPDLNGVYCTNLTIKQIRQILNPKNSKEETLEGMQNESEYLSVDASSPEDLDENSEKIIDDIVDLILKKSENYYLAQSHALLGIIMDDILVNLVNDYENEIVPKINSLSIEAKKELLEKLQATLNMYQNHHMEKGFFHKAINHIESELNCEKDGKRTIAM